MVAGDQQLLGALHRVVAEHGADHVHEHRLAVAALAVEHAEHVVETVTGQSRTEPALQVGALVGVRLDAIQEPQPPRCLGVGAIGRGADSGDAVVAALGAQLVGVEVEGAVGDAQKIGVRVEVVGSDGDRLVRGGQRQARLDPARLF